jgi:hypothetical protein
MKIGPSASTATTAIGEAMNRSETPSLGQDLRSVATVGAAALPLAEGMSSMPAMAKPFLGLPGKGFSMLSMMEGLRDTFSSGMKMATSFQQTSLEANNQAFDKAWDATIRSGGSLEEASAAGSSARDKILEDGLSGVREHGLGTARGAWKATSNGIDMMAPLPYGTGMDIMGKSMAYSFQSFAASTPAQQTETLRFVFSQNNFD